MRGDHAAKATFRFRAATARCRAVSEDQVVLATRRIGGSQLAR
jgi:hypothetical protein